MSGHIKAAHALKANRQINETLFVFTYLFKMLNMKLLTLMNNERLINMFLWRFWPRATPPAVSYPAICLTEQDGRSGPPISDINHTYKSKIGTESC